MYSQPHTVESRFHKGWFSERLGWLTSQSGFAGEGRRESSSSGLQPKLNPLNTPLSGPEDIDDDAAGKIKALSHPQRFAITLALASGPKTVNELVDIMGIRQPAVSQLLSRLRDASLVRPERHGKYVVYRLFDQQTKLLVSTLANAFTTNQERKGPPRGGIA